MQYSTKGSKSKENGHKQRVLEVMIPLAYAAKHCTENFRFYCLSPFNSNLKNYVSFLKKVGRDFLFS